MKAAKESGKLLGTQNPVTYARLAANNHWKTTLAKCHVALKQKRQDFYAVMRPVIEELQAEGFVHEQIAEHLNKEGFLTIKGHPWVAGTVQQMMQSAKNIPRKKRTKVSPKVQTKCAKWEKDGVSFEAMAEKLNVEKLLTSTGKEWTENTLWCYLKRKRTAKAEEPEPQRPTSNRARAARRQLT